jgi:hypothetical protein
MPPNFNPLRFCVLQRVSDEERHSWIETAAYYRAEHRGFAPGNEAADWIAAEVEVEYQIAQRSP